MNPLFAPSGALADPLERVELELAAPEVDPG